GAARRAAARGRGRDRLPLAIAAIAGRVAGSRRPHYGEDMPDSVRSIGATASLNHDGSGDDPFAVVDLRLFALTDGGEQVDDPQPASLSVRCERAKLAALELSVLMSMRLSRPPTGTRLAAWQRICEELAARGITTDPATLHALRFSLTPDGELRTAQQAVWPHGH
ncbi:MAG: hypothetical protein QOG42_1418, partial [Solirubrobacteraceae bacterium]|nr:hypothetical protein [Solirubrobacteraceae bacterium]